ncbi:MAG: hypothetical protein IKN43_14985 [Selenomonadaceae bacterium]|nr:hypothetical protein [Selenomonadaceae bacterium]
MNFQERQKKFQKIGEFKDYTPPAKIELVTRVPIPVQEEKNNAPLEMQQCGNYSVARMTSRGEMRFQPLAPLSEYIQNGGTYHLGGAYYETAYGYAVALKDGLHEFTNFKGKILAKEVEMTASGERSEYYVINLNTAEGKNYTVRVSVNQWASLLDIIENTFPFCQVYGDEINNHRERFKRLTGFWLKNPFPTKLVAKFWGWGSKMSNGARLFYHGGRDDCRSDKVLPVALSPENERQMIKAAFENIMAAGPFEVTAPLLLYALASYTDAIFTDAGFPLAHCVMIIGESGFLKSSFAKEIFSPFVPYNQKTFTVRSTEASMNVLHEKAFDDTLVIDDFNLEGSPSEARMKMKNIRGLIRGYSDKTPRAKYGGADNVKQYALRGGCVFTAETTMSGQLKSGELRYFKVFLHSPLNKIAIAALHDNPNLVPIFYGAYIRFLEQSYSLLINYVRAEFPKRRSCLNIPEPRMKDAAIHLTLTAEILKNLLIKASIFENDSVKIWYQKVCELLCQMAMQQSLDAQIGEPYLRYLAEVWNLIGTGKLQIAPNLPSYVNSISNYIGYRENDLLIIKKDELYKAVIDAFFARNESLPIGIDEVSKKLKSAGLTKCDRDSCLLKASSKIQGRPRMLALIISECVKKLDGGQKL